MIAKFVVALGYAWSLLSMVVVSSIQHPENIKAWTSDHDVWLYPELQRGWDVITGAEIPYQDEKAVLESSDD